MKKLIIAVATMGILGMGSLVANANNNEDKKADYLKKTKEEMVTSLKDMGLDEAKSTKFADCYVEELGKVITEDEAVALDVLKEGEMPSQELQDKLAKIGQACSAVLQ